MDGFTKGRAAILHNPINYMIYHQETFFPGLAQGFPDEPEKPYWWVMFQHTYLIYYATLIHAYKDPEKNYDHAVMCASVIKGSMSNLVERTHPGAWKELHGWTRVDKLGPFPGDPAVGLFPEGHPLAWMKRPESEDDSDEEREHDEIPENCRIAAADVPAGLDDETFFYNALNQLRESTLANTSRTPEEKHFLLYFRTGAVSTAHAVAEYSGDGNTFTIAMERPLDYVVSMLVGTSEKTGRNLYGDPNTIPSRDIFLRRFLILRAVTLKSISSSLGVDENKYARAAIQELCEREVGSTNPELAEELSICLGFHEALAS
ncbi:hypothetical protein JCM16303_006259 [Sporobolomyces ruberrimus]